MADKVLEFIELFNGINEKENIDKFYTNYNDVVTKLFTNGECGRFSAILKTIFPKAIPYFISDKYIGNHIITKIDDKYYDINGEFNINKKSITYIEQQNETFLNNYIKYAKGYYEIKHTNQRQGSYRKVFLLKNVVIKVPINFKGILANINEIYNWYRYKEYKHLMCLIKFHDVLGLVIVMKRAEVVSEEVMQANNYYKWFRSNFNSNFNNNEEYTHPIANDLKANNFGIINGNLVKIDYGNDYWLYNVGIDIKNIFKKLIKVLQKVLTVHMKGSGGDI